MRALPVASASSKREEALGGYPGAESCGGPTAPFIFRGGSLIPIQVDDLLFSRAEDRGRRHANEKPSRDVAAPSQYDPASKVIVLLLLNPELPLPAPWKWARTSL
jgi:hypothetical protein